MDGKKYATKRSDGEIKPCHFQTSNASTSPTERCRDGIANTIKLRI